MHFTEVIIITGVLNLIIIIYQPNKKIISVGSSCGDKIFSHQIENPSAGITSIFGFAFYFLLLRVRVFFFAYYVVSTHMLSATLAIRLIEFISTNEFWTKSKVNDEHDLKSLLVNLMIKDAKT